MGRRNDYCILINVRDATPLPGFYSMPLGVLAVGGNLLSAGFDVRVHDGANEKELLNELRDEIEEGHRPLMVGLSVMSHSLKNALVLTRTIKSLSPETPVIWGGVHPTLFPEQVASLEEVDIAVIGEGHETAVEIARSISLGSPLRGIGGIAFREGGEIKITSRRIASGYTLEPLPYHLLDVGKYVAFLQNSAFHGELVSKIDVISSVGCPYRCRFCINVADKRSYRTRDITDFVDELERLVSLHGVRYFKIMDEYFFGSLKRIRWFLDIKRRRGLKFYWDANTRADAFRKKFTREFLRELREEGCVELLIGAESGSQKVLDMLHKDILVEDIVSANSKGREAGISITFSFMAGIPGETPEDLLLTKRLIMRLQRENPDTKFIGPQLYRPYPGAPLTEDAARYGFSMPDTVQGWIDTLSSDIYGEFCSSRDMPWIEDPGLTDRVLRFLYLYLGTVASQNNPGIMRNAVRKTAHRWFGIRLEKDFYSLPLEAALLDWKMRYNKKRQQKSSRNNP